MPVISPTRRRRLGGWGFEGESLPPSEELLRWLADRLGPPLAPVPTSVPDVHMAAARLPPLPAGTSTEPRDRLAHARGQGLVDVLRLRTGRVPALPDAVLRPADADQVEAVLAACDRDDIRVIPWGGGTSVTGGVNVLAGDSPVVTLDLERMSDLTALDEISGLATFGPGAVGPAVETALAAHGLTLGHYPQSWELATVGGWAATRSSGQESLGYGRIEDLVAGLELVAPAGRLELPARPASAAGPDLRQLVMGSEGRLGVITRVDLRVRPRPAAHRVEAALLPDLGRGLEACRQLLRNCVPLTMLRLSDASETQVALAIGLAHSPWAALGRRYLGMRGLGADACLMLLGSVGSDADNARVLSRARAFVRRQGGVSLGRGPGNHWLRDRFRHPYLRESLLDLGLATDTLETAASWAAAPRVRERVAAAITGALEPEGERVAVLCHVSHPYPDGTSLYFTFFFRTSPDPDATVARWARVKRAANRALLDAGATLSHHHGVGQWHAAAWPEEVGDHGRALVQAAAQCLDPKRILNPHVLLDPEDRLEA